VGSWAQEGRVPTSLIYAELRGPEERHVDGYVGIEKGRVLGPKDPPKKGFPMVEKPLYF